MNLEKHSKNCLAWTLCVSRDFYKKHRKSIQCLDCNTFPGEIFRIQYETTLNLRKPQSSIVIQHFFRGCSIDVQLWTWLRQDIGISFSFKSLMWCLISTTKIQWRWWVKSLFRFCKNCWCFKTNNSFICFYSTWKADFFWRLAFKIVSF